MAQTYRERRRSEAWIIGREVRVDELFLDDPLGQAPGECEPPMDVLETAHAVEVIMDLPGVSAADLRIVFSEGTLIVAGRKLPGPCQEHAAFHLAERSFGRFVRAIRLAGAFDAGRARASLTAGELRVSLPRIEERRGREIRISIT